jgi:protein-tyrosine phosphatase
VVFGGADGIGARGGVVFTMDTKAVLRALCASAPIQMSESRTGMFKILVVCTANICRSPAAQYFLRRALEGKQVKVESAGTLALDGNAADPTIQALMLERGFEAITEHRSRALMPSHLTQYDLVLCMERDHMARVQKLNPLGMNRTRLFGHWENRAEVDDPVGRSRQTYIRSLDDMQRLTDQWVEKMSMMGMVQ